MKPRQELYRPTVCMNRAGSLSIVQLEEMFDTVVWTQNIKGGVVVYRHRDSSPTKKFRSRYYGLLKLGPL